MIRSLVCLGSMMLTLCLFGTASAGTVTLDFNGGCNALFSGNDRSTGQVGALRYTDRNWSLYNHCSDDILLGDDGFAASNDVTIDPGFRFDLTSFDLSGSWTARRLVYNPSFDDSRYQRAFARGRGRAPSRFRYMTVTGFRKGVEVERLSFDPSSRSRVRGLARFTDLDRVTFNLNLYGLDDTVQVLGRYIYQCDGVNGRCGNVSYDNLTVDVRPLGTSANVTPVPLPASVGLIGLAFAGLGIAGLRRRKRTARNS